MNRGISKKLLGNYEDACQTYKDEITAGNATTDTYNQLGIVRMLFQDYHEAIVEFDNALQLDSENSDALYNRGLAFILTYKSTQGCTDLQQAYDLGNTNAREKMTFFCKENF